MASSSKPHWHMTTLAPDALTCATMVAKYSFSAACSARYASGDVMDSVCLVLGLGGSNGHVRMQMRASSTTLGICGCDQSFSSRMPRISSVSSIMPPALPSTLIKSKLTSLRSQSATLATADTAISAILRLFLLMILDDLCVCARARVKRKEAGGKARAPCG